MGKMDVSDVSDKLDKLCIEKLELLDELVEAKYILENTMREGFFNMGKARYIMGTNSVSQLQIPSDECSIEPLITSVSNKESKDGLEYLSFEVHKNTPKVEAEKAEPKSEEPKERKLKGDSNVEDLKPEDKIKKPVDPIKWFGGLPPQCLRQAQSHFTSAISLAARVATLQNKLISLNNTYKNSCAKS